MPNIRKFLLLFLFILAAGPLFAHPHLAIFSRCAFDFKNEELQGAWIDFRFDKYFSADIIFGFDQNEDGVFDKSETEDVYNHAFINLENYGYFLFIREGENRWSPDRVSRFSVRQDGDFVIYRFYIDLSRCETREVFVSVFDPTYFCACYFEEDNAVTIESDKTLQTDTAILENDSYPVYYDPFAPATDLTTHDKWRPGLETAYPEEIRLAY